MGIYLNPGDAFFREAIHSKIYVDKTGLISKMNEVLGTQQKYVCVSRPRRFGKSMALNMLSAYYDRTVDSRLFDGFHIAAEEGMKEQGRYNVLRINMQEFVSETDNMEECIRLLQNSLLWEILEEYSDYSYFRKDNLRSVMETVSRRSGVYFVILIDEWDCIFREYPEQDGAQKKYLDFLRDWLKDKSYAALVYMTGILPVKKYGTHSALNMFSEYSMENPFDLAEYVGFTESEVRALCRKYQMDFEECRAWYDGYSFPRCGHIYNPKSVVSAMLLGTFDDYWNRTETFEALKVYIDMNFDGLRDSVISMMAGGTAEISTGSFQNDMTSLQSADDVQTLLIHLGYLGYDYGKKRVFIPNREIMAEFVTATVVSRWDEVIRSVKISDRLLRDTWEGNEEAVAGAIEKAHLETSHLQYNDENALSYTISLAYYAARQYYTVIRELPAGKGFADLVFVPLRRAADKPAMIVELKWDQSADSGIRQIYEKKYPEALRDYKGNLLLVSVNYDKKTRKHTAKIEKWAPRSSV